MKKRLQVTFPIRVTYEGMDSTNCIRSLLELALYFSHRTFSFTLTLTPHPLLLPLFALPRRVRVQQKYEGAKKKEKNAFTLFTGLIDCNDSPRPWFGHISHRNLSMVAEESGRPSDPMDAQKSD